MTAQLRKEIRALTFPALLTGLCALVFLMPPFFERYLKRGWPLPDLSGLAQFGFFAGIIFLAAMSFGSEFQHRTFVLLLSQPTERFRIWRDKMLALAAIVPVLAIIGVIYCVSRKLSGLPNQDDLLMTLGVLGAVIIVLCSTTYWTLGARSIIGGVVFSASVMFAGGGLLTAGVEKIIQLTGAKDDPKYDLLVGAIVIGIGLIYSAICLRAGWRKFATMELRDTFAGEAISLPKYFPGAKWFGNLLRPRPTGSLRNLIRKELRLQKTIFLLAVLFTVGWLLMLGWSLLFPEHIDRLTGFTALSVIYLLMLAMLIGPAAFDEEKSLGLSAWHLTLPPSARRQWFVKFGVASFVCVLLGLCLPLLLALTVSDDTAAVKHYQFAWVPIFGFLLVLSFWAASLTGNMVRGVLTTIFTCFALGASAPLAGWIAEQLGGLQHGLLEFLTVKLHWSPDGFSGLEERVGKSGYLLIAAIVLLIALVQSVRCYRRAQAHEGIPLKRPLVLVLTAFLILLWTFDFDMSKDVSQEKLQEQLNTAFDSLSLRESDLPPEGQAHKLTMQQFENVQGLPARMKEWLENATIEVHCRDSKKSGPGIPYYAVIYFSNWGSWGVNLPHLKQPNQQQEQK